MTSKKEEEILERITEEEFEQAMSRVAEVYNSQVRSIQQTLHMIAYYQGKGYNITYFRKGNSYTYEAEKRRIGF